MTEEAVSYVVHRYESPPKPVSIRLEKNSRGFNWEVSAAGESVDAVLAILREAAGKLREEYGGE